jgi:hypothetical protein
MLKLKALSLGIFFITAVIMIACSGSSSDGNGAGGGMVGGDQNVSDAIPLFQDGNCAYFHNYA